MKGLLQDPAKIEQLAMKQKAVGDQNAVREKQKLLNDTAKLLSEHENMGKGRV
jgi:hypothetical protein